MTLVRLHILAAMLFGAAGLKAADPPKLLPFQGRLTDAAGNSVADGAKVVQFKIYDAPVGGQAVWNGEVQKLTVNGGLVSTVLGSKASLSSVDFNMPLYLEPTIDANGDDQISPADPPLLPRQSIFPALFAKSAGNAASLNGFSWNNLFTGGNPKTGALALGQDPGSVLVTDEGIFPPLDISGRPRIRQRAGGYNAGIWFYQDGPKGDRAFIGMRNDNTVAFYGAPGGDYGLYIDVNNLSVTIPRTLTVGGALNVGSLSVPSLSVAGDLRGRALFGDAANVSRLDSPYIVTSRVDFGAGNEVSRFINALGLFSPVSLWIGTPNVYLNGSLWATSDARLKRNICPLTNAVETLRKIRGVKYEFDNSCSLAKEAKLALPIEVQLGLIAQDIEAVLPEAVKTGENGIRGINYNAVTSLLIEAVKEQQRQIEKQQRQIEELSSKLAALRERKQ